MRIEFLRVYQQFGPGKFLDIGDGQAEVLIRRGIARPAAEAVAAPVPDAEANDPPPAPKPKKGK